MNKCPRCKSENIEDQGLTYAMNQKEPKKYLHKCKDCGNIFPVDKKDAPE